MLFGTRSVSSSSERATSSASLNQRTNVSSLTASLSAFEISFQTACKFSDLMMLSTVKFEVGCGKKKGARENNAVGQSAGFAVSGLRNRRKSTAQLAFP